MTTDTSQNIITSFSLVGGMDKNASLLQHKIIEDDRAHHHLGHVLPLQVLDGGVQHRKPEGGGGVKHKASHYTGCVCLTQPHSL